MDFERAPLVPSLLPEVFSVMQQFMEKDMDLHSRLIVDLAATPEEITVRVADRRPGSVTIFGELSDEQRHQLVTDAWTVGLRAFGTAYARSASPGGAPPGHRQGPRELAGSRGGGTIARRLCWHSRVGGQAAQADTIQHSVSYRSSLSSARHHDMLT
jgi:hypothetical protein